LLDAVGRKERHAFGVGLVAIRLKQVRRIWLETAVDVELEYRRTDEFV